ncbi:MAG: MTH1187 family thiamine-binding protein [Desulfobulbaceae bacterium]|nr:MTH1187 family thiamine-binding protein [Desulfobulbaceae bacterium]
MALMQITIIPVGTGSPSVGSYIADIERFLRGKDIEHSLHDMGTIIAAPVNDLFAMAEEIHRLPFTKGAERVITHITVDERADLDRKIGEKQQAVLRIIDESERL